MSSKSAAAHFTAILIVLGVVAAVAPDPHPTDQKMMEMVGQRVIARGCPDLNCFRPLVPAIVESFPGPSLPRWKAYSAFLIAAAAVAVGYLSLALGLTPRAALLAMWLSGVGFGSFATVYHPYTADALMFLLGPSITLLIVRGRARAAGALATIGIFAKEFAAAPLYIAAGAAALGRDFRAAARTLAIAVAVTGVWVIHQIVFMTVFDMEYGGNPSANLLHGGYAWFWLKQVGPRTAAFAMFMEFGAVYLLAGVGLWYAPARLRHLAIAAVPPAVALSIAQVPDRALWNFHFLAMPLAALVLARVPSLAQWLFVACFGMVNLRVGAQLPFVPNARYALIVSLAIATVAAMAALTGRSGRSGREITGRSRGSGREVFSLIC